MSGGWIRAQDRKRSLVAAGSTLCLYMLAFLSAWLLGSLAPTSLASMPSTVIVDLGGASGQTPQGLPDAPDRTADATPGAAPLPAAAKPAAANPAAGKTPAMAPSVPIAPPKPAAKSQSRSVPSAAASPAKSPASAKSPPVPVKPAASHNAAAPEGAFPAKSASETAQTAAVAAAAQATAAQASAEKAAIAQAAMAAAEKAAEKAAADKAATDKAAAEKAAAERVAAAQAAAAQAAIEAADAASLAAERAAGPKTRTFGSSSPPSAGGTGNAAGVSGGTGTVTFKGSEMGSALTTTFGASEGLVGRNIYVQIYRYMPLPGKIDESIYLKIVAKETFRSYYQPSGSEWLLKAQVPLAQRDNVWNMLEEAGFDASTADFRTGGKLSTVVLKFIVGPLTKNKVELVDVRLVSSSGSSEIDEAVIYGFRQASFFNKTGNSVSGRFVYGF